MTRDTILTAMRTFVQENFLYTNPDLQVDEKDSLLESGIVDSMGVMEIIDFLNETFGVTVPDEDITEDNLGSLAVIADYVLARK